MLFGHPEETGKGGWMTNCHGRTCMDVTSDDDCIFFTIFCNDIIEGL